MSVSVSVSVSLKNCGMVMASPTDCTVLLCCSFLGCSCGMARMIVHNMLGGGEGVTSPGSCGSNDTSLVASLFILQIVRGFNVLF